MTLGAGARLGAYEILGLIGAGGLAGRKGTVVNGQDIGWLSAVLALVGNAPAAIWLFDPGAAPLLRKLIELPPGPRLRGLTWAPDGTSIIVGKHDAFSDIVLFERSR